MIIEYWGTSHCSETIGHHLEQTLIYEAMYMDILSTVHPRFELCVADP